MTTDTQCKNAKMQNVVFLCFVVHPQIWCNMIAHIAHTAAVLLSSKSALARTKL